MDRWIMKDRLRGPCICRDVLHMGTLFYGRQVRVAITVADDGYAHPLRKTALLGNPRRAVLRLGESQ